MKIFGKIITYLQIQLQKLHVSKCHPGRGEVEEGKIGEYLCCQCKRKSSNLKINHEKCLHFANFRQIKCIFMQLILKKGVIFANFQRYDRKCTQLIAKKS